MTYNSFGDYLKSLPPDTIFRVWVRKRIFTPYEQDSKFIGQSLYEDDIATHIIITDVISLPDGDLLLATYNSDDNDKGYITYYKLSEIDLAKADYDMEEE